MGPGRGVGWENEESEMIVSVQVVTGDVRYYDVREVGIAGAGEVEVGSRSPEKTVLPACPGLAETLQW